MKAAVVDVRRAIQGRGEGTTFSLVKLSNADHRHREVDLIRITEAGRIKKKDDVSIERSVPWTNV